MTWTIFSLGLALIGTFIHATLPRAGRPARLLPQRPGADPRADRPLRRACTAASSRSPSPPRSPARCTTSCRCADWSCTCPAASSSPRSSTTTAAPSDEVQRVPRTWPTGRSGIRRSSSTTHAFALPAEQRRRHRRGRHGLPLPRARPRRPRPRSTDPDEPGHPPRARHRAPRHGPALRGVPRRRDRRGAAPPGPRDARRRGPGDGLARLPRRRPDGRERLPRAGRCGSRCCASGSAAWSARSAGPCARCAPASARTRASAPPSARWPATSASGSGVPIQVTLDESTQRLRPDVEAELLRITQEAMNNAVRHSEATLIEVQCTVAPPAGRDHRRRRRPGHPGPSRGLARAGDHGRARRLVEARFTVQRREPRGTVISVVLEGSPSSRHAVLRSADSPSPQQPCELGACPAAVTSTHQEGWRP